MTDMKAVPETSVLDIRNPFPQQFDSGPATHRMPHLKALTAVRALAAFYVGAYHCVRPFSLWGPLAHFAGAGYTGVSFFFFLSGFILTYTHGLQFQQGRVDVLKFWVARLARVYPLYLLVMLVAGWLGRREFHPLFHTVAYAADLVMMQSWSIRMAPFFNVVAWSLSVEAFYYFIFPFLAPRMRTRSLRSGLAMLVLGYAIALLPSLIALRLDPSAGWSEFPGPGLHHLVFSTRRVPILMVGQFMSGIALGWIYLQRPVSRAFSSACLAVGSIGLLTTLYFSQHLPYVLLHNGLLIPLFALLVMGLSKPNLMERALSWAPFVLLGEASYAFYLTHFMFNDFVKDSFHWPETPVWLLPRLAVLIPLSIALHLCVERPGRRMVLAWWANRRSVAEPQAA